MRLAAIGLTDVHVLALAEHPHARRVVRRLLPEADTQHVEEVAGRRQRGTAQRRVDRVAGRRGEHDIRHLERVRPLGAVGDGAQDVRVCALIALERVNEPDQLRERLQVAAALQIGARQERWEPNHLGSVSLTGSRDERIESLQHAIEFGTEAVDSARAGRNQQPVPDECIPIRYDRGEGRVVNHQSSRCTSSIDALAPSTRSLLIWIPAL